MNLFESYFITIFASYIIVGATFTDVIRYLKGSGFALPNLPSLPHVTVAGALATGTHGSGLQSGMEATVSSSVLEISFVRHDGRCDGRLLCFTI
jgi:FAD/FMN-containing dehydrogenase